MRNEASKAGATLLAILLAACSLGPEYQRPPLELPADWQATALPVDSEADPGGWWRRYQDPQLDLLIEQALAHNLDLKVAAANVAAARAALGFARAERWPTLALQADATRARASEDAAGKAADTATGARSNPSTLYSVAGVLNYEVDLFGALKNAATAAEARALETRYTAAAVRLTVVADVVSAYLNLRAAEAQMALGEAAQRTREAGLELEHARLRFGATTRLTVLQAQAELDNARSQTALFTEAAARARTALAVLSGASPTALLQQLAQPPVDLLALPAPSTVPPILPADLLARRPDIAAAEASLAAAHADVAAVRAAWLPRIDLTALIGTEALTTGALFSGAARTWSAGGALLAPLLDFGRGEADTAGAQARRERAEALYRQSIQNALREVRDALAALASAQARAAADASATQALTAALALAERQYRSGYIRFAELLDVRRSLLAAQLNGVASARDNRVAAANLFKALGGGWQESGGPPL